MIGCDKGWSMDRIRRGLLGVAGLSDEEVEQARILHKYRSHDPLV